jgi:hypothetical protein
MAEHLPSKSQALNSNPSTTKKKRRRRKERKGRKDKIKGVDLFKIITMRAGDVAQV